MTTESQDPQRWKPWWALTFAVALTFAILWPAYRGVDGFPLSNYPMFSRPKSTSARVYHVLGVSSEGRHRPVSPEIVGTDEIMQAYQTVKLAIRGGPSAAATLCERAAQRVLDDPQWADLTSLQVRIDDFDSVLYWQGERKPRAANVVAACPVKRGPS